MRSADLAGNMPTLTQLNSEFSPAGAHCSSPLCTRAGTPATKPAARVLLPLQLTALAVRAVALAAGLEPLVEAAAVEALAAGAAAQARQLAGGGLDD